MSFSNKAKISSHSFVELSLASHPNVYTDGIKCWVVIQVLENYVEIRHTAQALVVQKRTNGELQKTTNGELQKVIDLQS